MDLKISKLQNFQSNRKNDKKRQKQVRFIEKVNRASNNGENNKDQKIYAFMAHVSGNNEGPSGNFGDTSQVTIWILDSAATCHMTTETSDFIPGS